MRLASNFHLMPSIPGWKSTLLRSIFYFLHSAFSFVARIGGILALLSNLLSVYWKGAPAVLLGVVALAAGVLAIFFPETVGMNLPETMEEAENIGERNKGRGLCTCVCPTYSDMRAKIQGKNTREN